MDLLLQILGGGCYLLNKIFFALAEGKREAVKRRLKLVGWVVYILGVPAWVIILVGKHNWIAAAVEAGGVPAMVFGLFNVYHRVKKPRRSFDMLTAIFTYCALILGVAYSVYDNGGIGGLSQLLEIGVVVGFLMGSYLLAKNNLNGWLFFMLMNASMGTLMLHQGKPLLAVQQLVSLGFVLYGFRIATREKSASKRLDTRAA